MRYCARKTLRLALFAGVSAVALAAAAFAAQYSMTVNKDRLLNAQNEPQNWLMMNGDYGSTRYSKLSQINRENVKNLRMVWGLALGGLQDVGQNGPENEVNPLIDNGMMYATDGWGTLYKIDLRDQTKGQFVWVTDPGVKHQGNVPRTRGIALWEDLVIANLPDGRVIAVNRDKGEIVWDRMVAVTNADHTLYVESDSGSYVCQPQWWFDQTYPIETERGLALVFVRTMASVAVFGENGADIAVELDWPGSTRVDFADPGHGCVTPGF